MIVLFSRYIFCRSLTPTEVFLKVSLGIINSRLHWNFFVCFITKTHIFINEVCSNWFRVIFYFFFVRKNELNFLTLNESPLYIHICSCLSNHTYESDLFSSSSGGSNVLKYVSTVSRHSCIPNELDFAKLY